MRTLRNRLLKCFCGLLCVSAIGFQTLLHGASPLKDERAFLLQASVLDPNTLQLTWSIANNYYLYYDRFYVEKTPNAALKIGTISFPKPITKKDAENQNITVYEHTLTLAIPILGEKSGSDFLNIHYQGCSQEGFCYPPTTKTLKLTINEELALTNVTIEKKLSQFTPTKISQLKQLETLFYTHHWSSVLIIFFGLGLLLAFTPCVLPMVPVLSGIIVGHGTTITTKKAFLLSLTYVFSMSLTYACVGALVALLGSNLQILMQSPITIILFSLLFFILSLSMFGYFELKLPTSLQAKLAKANFSHESGHYLSALIMGILSTLILSPCVSAPLVGILSYIAQTGKIWIGGLSLFCLSFGMGTPLLLMGASAGKLLPKAGSWMNTVKYFFGILLIALAIQLLSRIFDSTLIMVLWAGLFIFTGVFCGAFISEKNAIGKLKQATGILLLGYGLLILTGAATGRTDPLKPLASLSTEKHLTKAIVVDTNAELQKILRQAKKENKPVLLDFYADWCRNCHTIEKMLLNNHKIQTQLTHIIQVKVDITKNTAASKALLKQYHVIAPPTLIFIDSIGNEIPEFRIIGITDTKTINEYLTSLSDS